MSVLMLVLCLAVLTRDGMSVLMGPDDVKVITAEDAKSDFRDNNKVTTTQILIKQI